MEIKTNFYRGKFKKDIEANTNDPVKNKLVFTVMATINESLSINPLFVNFGKVPVMSSPSIPVKITNNGKKKITVKSIEANPVVNLSVSPNRNIIFKPGETIDISVKFNSGKDAGVINGSIVLKTDIANYPDKMIFVKAEVIAK